MSIDRKRLTPDESRDRALEAARQILLDEGPQAVTLKAVASRIDRTHANILHHFGSAAGLQKALAGTMADQVCATIAGVVQQARRGEADPHTIVDLCFDAFDRQGAGALAIWMLLSGNEDALDPILAAILRLVDELSVDNQDGLIRQETLNLVLMALGDALLGKPMADALGLPRETARNLAYQQLLASPGLQARMAKP
ncbi:HTH tetR-type domain-containing protein [Sphingomonas antarctica]|uniref:TetR/AcrR family transcriptional regulator n=1 Tax=Sphingomonas antarctica TaxID=2040274 RepID=UPI0039EA3E80